LPGGAWEESIRKKATMDTGVFRGLAQPQLSRLNENLALLEYSDPGAIRARMSTNGFALLADEGALLFDTGAEELLPLIDQLRSQGFSPRGLVLSHRHIAGAGGAVPMIPREYGVPVFLHPFDARHPQAMAAGIAYEDPVGHPLMTAFGVEVVHLPGHTAGSIGLYLPDKGGTLLAGDAAMGPSAVQTKNGVEYLIRPPVMMNVNDAELRTQWLGFHRPLASVLPYHGTGYLDRVADLPTIMAPLTRLEPTMGLQG
jgi:glyoxylase-like metal-dependent hydrolase (beta-lactamase superfamily II)